jgi:inosine-uridine nucleoside N-ribohydrolase
LQAIYAAPFLNERSTSPKDGMEKSYDEILKILRLANEEAYIEKVFKGSEKFLTHDRVPVASPACWDLVERARQHTPENPLYVIGIAAATNIASAILTAPDIIDRIVVIWLGGSAHHCDEIEEFNLIGDVKAAQVFFECDVRLVHLPCCGVVENFAISPQELEAYLLGKNPLADYLAQNTLDEINRWKPGFYYTKVIWDVTAVAWLLNEDNRFMSTKVLRRPLLKGRSGYFYPSDNPYYGYVYRINRDSLMTDLIKKLTM